MLPTDDRYRLSVEALARRVAEDEAAGLQPFFVVATGGTTNTGSVDPLAELADLCASAASGCTSTPPTAASRR